MTIILIKDFDFESANWYYKKILYQTVITNIIPLFPTTKTGLYKVQAPVVQKLDSAIHRINLHSVDKY